MMNQQLTNTRRGRMRLTLLSLTAAVLAGPALAGNTGFSGPSLVVAPVAQQTITGTVRSAVDNVPLSGVSVAVKGTGCSDQ